MTGKWILHLLMLTVCSVEDWRKKEVSLWKILIYAVAVVGYMAWELYRKDLTGQLCFPEIVMGAMPGVAMLILAKATGEEVGYADGMLTVIMGFSMGFWNTAGILSIAFGGIFIVAAVLFMWGNKEKKRRIAFIPFLLMGMAGAGLWINFQ